MKKNYLTNPNSKKNIRSKWSILILILMFTSISYAQTAEIITTSSDNSWIAGFSNTGGLSLSWQAVGAGITTQTGTGDFPVFDFSSNTSNLPITVTITSPDGFNKTTGVTAPAKDITAVNFSNLINLTDLELPNNSLTSIDISSNVNLKKINVSTNNLTSISFVPHTLLEEVYVYGNDITNLSFLTNPALRIVDASNNDLTTLNVGNNLALQKLDLSSNDLTSINISANASLTILDLDFNKLTTVSINQILNDINAFGTSNGDLGLQGNPGTITKDGIVSYQSLLSRDWIIRPPVTYDFGDAPDTYSTSLINGGPQHINGARDIKLGLRVDTEVDAFVSGLGDGDDINNIADEDGAVLADFNGLKTSTDNFTLQIDYTNNYTIPVTIYAWIDFDISGTFDSDEFTSLTVPIGGFGTVNLLWSNLIANGVDFAAGTTFARVRITTDVLTGANAGGIVSDGEVEDYGGIVISLDTDGDGIIDTADVDDDNDGILDTVEDNGVANRDTDGDGIPDRLELDADNDGCFDVLEAGFTDGDADGKLGSAPITVDANGQITGQGGYTPPADLDANGTPDFQEAGAAPVITTQPVDQNYIIGTVTFSAVSNGFEYQWEESTDGGLTWTPLTDGGAYSGTTTADLSVTLTDLSKLNNQYRVIATNPDYVCAPDTISNAVSFIAPVDTDTDGVPDIVDLDDDNDGILDTVEDNGVANRDTDGDGIPDRLELDADNDGCFDVVEAGFADGDADGKLGSAPITVDANGQITGQGGYTAPADLNANGTPDFQEAGVAATITTQPVNQNFALGTTSFTAVASADTYQWQVSTDAGATWADLANGGDYAGVTTSTLTVTNTDLSKVNYLYRLVVSNSAYACDPTTTSASAGYITPGDTDSDGVPDIVDLDDDNDGILDTVEDNGVANRDTDGDGIPDRLELDADNDGCFDAVEAGFTDGDADGKLGSAPISVDAQGRVTSGTNGYTAPADLNANGIRDFQEGGAAAAITTQPANQNFIPNASATFTVVASADTYQWQVSPNGGAWVSLVNGGNYSGVTTASLTVSNLAVGNINDRYRVVVNNRAYACDPGTTSGSAGYVQLTDTDGDGVPDLVDVDDDNDGILDTVEDNGVANRDTDGDGTPDRLELDSDNDGCRDVIEAGFTDTDGDGRLGNIVPPTVDATGRVTSGTDGYTAPANLNANGTPDFQEAGAVSVITTQPVNRDFVLNGSATFTSAASADTFQWQVSLDGVNWTDLSDNANYSGTKTPVLTISNMTVSFYYNKYRVRVRNIAYRCDPGSVSNTAGFNTLPDTDKDGVLDIVDLDDDNDGILDTVEGGNTDTDGDTIPDRLDLDSDNDKCLDVVEAGFNDGDGDGRLGNSPVTVDAQGRVTGQGGYVTPKDLDSNGKFDFQEAGSASVISNQPEDVEVTLGAQTTFEVSGSATYFQWQVSTNDGASWTDLVNDNVYSGVTTNKLTVSQAIGKYEGYLYRVVLTSPDFACDPNDSLISDPAILLFNTELIPNGFSPNGDGVNDVFFIPGLVQSPNFKMEVFDRWGNSVYKYSNNGNLNPNWWNGESTGTMTLNKGQRVPAGTYFYLIDFNDGIKTPAKGWVYVNY